MIPRSTSKDFITTTLAIIALVVAMAGMMLPAIAIVVETKVSAYNGKIMALTLDFKKGLLLNVKDLGSEIGSRSHKFKRIYIILVKR